MDTHSGFRKNLLAIVLLLHLFGSCTSSAQQTDTASGVSGKSDVEFLIALSQTIIHDKARLQNLRSESIRLEPIFRQTSQRFLRITTQNDSLRNAESSLIQRTVLEQEWRHLRNTLDFLLQYRRSIHQQSRIVQRKIDKEQEGLDFSMEGQFATILENTEQRILTTDIDHLPADSTHLSDTVTADGIAQHAQEEINRYNWRIVEAERELARLKAKFDIAKKSWLLVKQLTELNQDDRAIAQAFAQTAANELALLKQTSRSVEESRSKTDDSLLLAVLENRWNETQRLVASIQKAVVQDTPISKEVEARLVRLAKIQVPLTEAVADITNQIDKKSRWLDYLYSPLAPHRIYHFFVHTGPRVLAIILVFFLIWTLGRVLIRYLLRGLVRSKSPREQAERIETLTRTTQSGLTLFVLLGGALALLSEMDVEVSVLLGGAAVVSVAIGFGMQSLIKDYAAGFTIMSENQYRVGNVVSINQTSGVVEDISLRMTVLRDPAGAAHFIPHGSITTVSNLTHGWSRVELDVSVAYKEDVDRVMGVILEIAKGMRKDAVFGELITDEPEMLGVDALAESAVILKMLVKTKPQQQWLVKRELLRRIKNRFDKLGIEIPFPHYTISTRASEEPIEQVSRIVQPNLSAKHEA